MKFIYLRLFYVCLALLCSQQISRAQVQCMLMEPPGGNTSTPLSSWCVYESGGEVSAAAGCKFFVRIYMHVVKDPVTQLPVYDQADVYGVVNRLQADFNPHGIYFVWDSILRPLDAQYYDNPSSLVMNTSNADGIDIYLLNEHTTPNPRGGGISCYKGDPYTALLVYGNFPFFTPYTSLSLSPMVSHEMGHVLGLLHTDNCAAVNEHPEGQPGDGDYVSDTPPDENYNFDVDPATCTAAGTGDPTNIMANTHPGCMLHFTVGQGARMRYFLATENTLQNVIVKPSSSLVSSAVTWNSPVHLMEDLRIASGAALTITSEVFIAEGVKIIVDPGARLMINGGHLTNQCKGRWKGIEVRGNNSLSQNLVEGMYLQGYVQVTNHALIEQMEKGIYTETEGSADGYGGIIQAQNSTFRNNRVAVDLKNYILYVNGAPQANKSFFKDCIFENTAAYGDVDDFDCFISLHQVYTVSVTSCRFANNGYIPVTDTDRIGIGIRAVDAKFNATARCTSSPLPGEACSAADMVPSVFENLNAGVAVYRVSENFDYRVDQCQFRRCNTAVYNNAVNNALITRNTIFIGENASTGIVKAGIVLYTGTNYKVEENHIISLGESVFHETGIVVYNTGTQTNRIYKNTFEGLDVANTAVLVNKNPALESVGLSYECNVHLSSVKHDIYVAGDENMTIEGIGCNQGFSSKAAGNVFSHSGHNAESDVKNDADQQFQYYYSGSTVSPYYPAYVTSGMVKQNSGTENACPTGFYGASLGTGNAFSMQMTITEKEEQVELFAIASSLLSATLKSYDSLVDNGNTSGLIFTVNTTPIASIVVSQLLSISPFVSERIILAMADRPDRYSNNDLYTVLYANPELNRNSALLNFLATKPGPMMKTQIDNLRARALVSSVRSTYLDAISQYAIQRDRAAQRMLFHLLSDTSAFDRTTWRNWLKKMDNLEAVIQLADDYCATGQTDSAEIVKTDWQARYVQNPGMEDQGIVLDDLYDFLSNDGLDTIPLNQLDSTRLSTVKGLAVAGHGIGSVRARGILALYGEFYMPPIPIPGGAAAKTVVSGIPEKTEGEYVHLYPNPARADVTVEWDVEPDTGKLLFEVWDAMGKFIMNAEWQGETGAQKLDISSLAAGVYYWSITKAGEAWEHGKLMIIR